MHTLEDQFDVLRGLYEIAREGSDVTGGEVETFDELLSRHQVPDFEHERQVTFDEWELECSGGHLWLVSVYSKGDRVRIVDDGLSVIYEIQIPWEA